MCMKCGSLVNLDEIYGYYSIYTMTSDDDTLFIHYDYIQLLANVTIAKQVI